MGIIGRAYQLAKSGDCHDIKDVERRLRAEHFDAVLQHLNSPTLRRELMALVRASGHAKSRQEPAQQEAV